MARRLWFWIPVVAYMAVIFYLSAQSNPLPEITTRVWDKLLHTIEYAGLAFLVCRALRSEGVTWGAAFVLTLIITSAYGATDEWHQSYVPMRTADVFDWLTDTIAGLVGAGVWRAAAVMIRRA